MIFFNASYSQKIQSIEIGDTFPISHINYPMKSVNGKDYSISQHLNKNGLILIFTSNSCPFVVAWEDRYQRIEDLSQKYNFEMLYMILTITEEGLDSYKAMQSIIKKWATHLIIYWTSEANC